MQEPGTDLAAGVLTSTGGGGGTRTLGRAGGAPKRVASRPVRPPGRQGQQRRRAAPPGGRGEGYKSTPREQAGGDRSAAVAAHGERLLGQVGVGPPIYLSVFLPVSLSIHPSQPSNHPLNLPLSLAAKPIRGSSIASSPLFLFIFFFLLSHFLAFPPLFFCLFSLFISFIFFFLFFLFLPTSSKQGFSSCWQSGWWSGGGCKLAAEPCPSPSSGGGSCWMLLSRLRLPWQQRAGLVNSCETKAHTLLRKLTTGACCSCLCAVAAPRCICSR